MGPIDFLVQNMMIPFLTFSYEKIYPNYGLAILLLTGFVKIAFYPLTRKQFEQMKVNQQIQPLIKEIQEKYKKQPEKMHKELMRIWKEHKANPMKGCLPALIQLPFFLAVFYTIQSAAFTELLEKPGVNPGLFWWSNLTAADPTYILPIIIGLTTYWSQKYMITDPKQAAIFMFMPVLMFFVCLKMPAGVLLYWAFSSMVSLIQQAIMMKKAKPA